jgi:hypothetical protein
MNEYKYPVEIIPPESHLFRRFPPYQYNPVTGKAIADTFNKEKCSVDWDRYASPQDTLSRVKKNNPWGVVRIQAGYVRSVGEQKVLHEPYFYQAHSEISGKKNMEICDELAKGAHLVIMPKF